MPKVGRSNSRDYRSYKPYTITDATRSARVAEERGRIVNAGVEILQENEPHSPLFPRCNEPLYTTDIDKILKLDDYKDLNIFDSNYETNINPITGQDYTPQTKLRRIFSKAMCPICYNTFDFKTSYIGFNQVLPLMPVALKCEGLTKNAKDKCSDVCGHVYHYKCFSDYADYQQRMGRPIQCSVCIKPVQCVKVLTDNNSTDDIDIGNIASPPSSCSISGGMRYSKKHIKTKRRTNRRMRHNKTKRGKKYNKSKKA